MKKAYFLFLIVASMLLTSCSLFNGSNWIADSQKEITDKVMQRISDGISNHNLGVVKKEFRYIDVSQIVDFDISIHKLFEYVMGDIVGYSRISSGSDEKGLGYADINYRLFSSCQYVLNTSTDAYKILFSYYSYYADTHNKPNEDKIGIQTFDIINEKNDRKTDNRYYSGDPENKPGIKFDYKTMYSMEEFIVEKAYYTSGEEFDPIIINSVSDLNDFYARNKGNYSLEKRDDKMGYLDVITKYEERFFETKSLYVVGMFHEDTKYKYIPQWLFIGDFVMTRIAPWFWEYEDNDNSLDGEYFVEGSIIMIELPEKVSSDIKAKVNRSSELLQTN